MSSILKNIVCFLLGHKPSFNSKDKETVFIVRIDGTVGKSSRTVEREWCGRCKKLIKEELC